MWLIEICPIFPDNIKEYEQEGGMSGLCFQEFSVEIKKKNRFWNEIIN